MIIGVTEGFSVFQAGPWLQLPATRRSRGPQRVSPAGQLVLQQGALRQGAALVCQAAAGGGDHRYGRGAGLKTTHLHACSHELLMLLYSFNLLKFQFTF